MGTITSCSSRILVTLLFVFGLVFSQSGVADNLDQSANMFVFQQKLANKGNPKAQYRLGFMYETGQGVAADTNKALEWYRAAANQGNHFARDRMTYLKVKEKGYNVETDSHWLSDVRSEAFANKPESMFLLAQLYHEGIGVKKDLNKSLNIFYRLGTEGMAAVDGELAKVEAEIKQYQVKRKKHIARKKPVEKPVAQQVVAKKPEPAPKVQTATSELSKREKYEAIMRKLAKEQEEIDRLQGWTEGSSIASIDDEI